uniref:Transmembrane protein 230 n=1 Tax=Branchiostoma floridae TaxID=7739 RepID=C3XVW7_BRAFL|eukprot:XP_002611901.1 hypothetical protein BRAFLDRAFT_106801 [Branchiostoma floridae]
MLGDKGIEESEDDSLLEQPRTSFPIRWYSHPKVQEHKAAVIASFLLLFIGIAIDSEEVLKKFWNSSYYFEMMFEVEMLNKLTSVFLILTALIIVGVVLEVNVNRDIQPIVFIVIGAICFIPGVYHVVYIYCAIQGRPGFHFSSLPSFR